MARPIRRTLLALAALLLLLLVAAGAGLFWRKELAARLIAGQLEDLGLASAEFRVEEVGLSSLTLHEVSLDLGGRATAQRLTVSYGLWRLLGGEIDSVTLEAPRLVLDFTGEGQVLPDLPLAPSGAGDTTTLPRIVLTGATVEAATVIGAATLELSGTLAPDESGRPAGDFNLTLRGPLGEIAGTLSIGLANDETLGGFALLERGHVELPGGRIGGLSGRVSFRLGGPEPPFVEANLGLSGVEVARAGFDEGTLAVSLEKGQATMSGRLAAADGSAEAELAMAAAQIFDQPRLKADARLHLAAGSPFWALFALPEPAAGSLEAGLAFSGTLAPLDSLFEPVASELSGLRHSDLTGNLRLGFAGLELPGRIENLNGSFAGDWTVSQGIAALSIAKAAEFTVDAFDPAWLVDLGLPTDTAEALAGGARLYLPADGPYALNLLSQPAEGGRRFDAAAALALQADSGTRLVLETTLAAERKRSEGLVNLSIEHLDLEATALPIDGDVIGRLKLVGDLAGPPTAIAGTVDLDLAFAQTNLGKMPATDLGGSGRFALEIGAEGLRATLQKPGTAHLGQLVNGDDPLLLQPVSAPLESGWVALAWGDEDLILTHEATLALAKQTLAFGPPDDQVSLTGNFGTATLVGRTNADFDYGGTAMVRGADLALPAYGLILGKTDADWVFPLPDEAPMPGRVSVGQGTVDTGLGKLTGIVLDATVVETATGVTLTAEGRGAGGIGKLKLTLSDDNATGKGEVVADWGPITFKPGGLQPGQLLAKMKDFKAVSGILKARFRTTWSATAGRSELQLTLGGFAFEHPFGKVEGLDTKLVFDRLAPLSLKPTEFAAKRLDLGVDLQDVKATVALEPKKSPVYVVSNATFSLWGGRFRLGQLRWDERAPQVSAMIEVTNLDLAALARELALSDLSMEGLMSGQIPLSFTPADETLVIATGQLRAQGPGVIRYGQPGTASLRAGGDERFALALQALEDFRFTRFDIDIDKAADGKTRLFIVLVGANPAVLDGYPFHLNINLNTDLSQVLTALRDGYRLNADLFKGGWTFQ